MALKHTVTDTDNNFSINPTTRVIKNESPGKNYLIQYDHNSEIFSFEMPRMVEKHDMSNCDSVEVHYVNIDAKTQLTSAGIYKVKDVQVSDQDPNVIIFTWLIDQAATKYVGSLNFLVRFACEDDTDPNTYSYVWNTAVHTDIKISSGLCNSDVIYEDYTDVLQQWLNEVQGVRMIDLQQTIFSEDDEGANVWTATFADGTTRDLTVKNGSKGDPGGIGDPGKSAYKYAQEGGFTGSEDDFKKSLLVPTFYEGTKKLEKVTFVLDGTTLKITTQ